MFSNMMITVIVTPIVFWFNMSSWTEDVTSCCSHILILGVWIKSMFQFVSILWPHFLKYLNMINKASFNTLAYLVFKWVGLSFGNEQMVIFIFDVACHGNNKIITTTICIFSLISYAWKFSNIFCPDLPDFHRMIWTQHTRNLERHPSPPCKTRGSIKILKKGWDGGDGRGGRRERK